MQLIINLLLFLIMLSVIICVHELGHLIAAKIFGVYCYEYSFGMGPKLFQKKGKETVYSIRALPIGGYVAMAGETDGDAAYPDVQVPEGRRLTDQKPWKKIIIMLAGVFMNFVTCIVILAGINLYQGVYVSYPEAVVADVEPGGPADTAGLKAGDRIVKITKEDGSSVSPENYMDISSFVYGYSGEETYIVERNGEEFTYVLTPEYDAESESYRIGIYSPEPSQSRVTLFNCLYYGFEDMRAICRVMVTTLAGLFFHGSNLDQLSGPVGIYEITSTAASMGIASFLFLMAQLSLNIGIFNLLPLPVLDGGQVVVTVVEWVLHRPLNQKVKTGIMGACWILLIGFMLFVTWNDISRILIG
ncbi:MAG: RIP metalloprotease RseP [Bulleidia sp.]